MNTTNLLEKGHASGKSRLLAIAIPLLMLTAATLLAFANAWPDKLVLDDRAFLGLARPHELDSLYYIFTHDVWSVIGMDSGFYRPLLLLGLSVETWVFGDWLAGYHLSNILHHLLVTFLVYGFFCHLLCRTGEQSASSGLWALLAALVFAVHPIHTEAVNSIFNRSEMMVAMFGLAGLWWLLHYLDARRSRAWVGLGIAYFLALLSKESAVVIPALAVVMILLLTSGDLKTRIRKCLPVFWLLLPLAVYLAMRTYALAQPELASVGLAAAGGGVNTAAQVRPTIPGFRTFFAFAVILGQSVKVIVWPYPLRLYYGGLSTLMSVGYTAITLVLITAALVQLIRKRFSLAAGLAFFLIAMLPASRILDKGESGAHLAERYLYFPSVGLAIILAFALKALAQRFGSRIMVNFGMPVLLLLTALTWDRNTDWASDISLFETEYQLGNRGPNSLRLLTATLVLEGNPARAVQVCDENWEKQEEYARFAFVYFCAVAYENQHRYQEAERAYLLQIEQPNTRIGASMALAHFYIRHDRRPDAEQHFLAAIDWSVDPADKALYQGEMILSLNPTSRKQGIIAREHIEEALRLHPEWSKAESILKQLNNALNSPRTPQSMESGLQAEDWE